LRLQAVIPYGISAVLRAVLSFGFHDVGSFGAPSSGRRSSLHAICLGVMVMATREDIGHYLIQVGHLHETIADNMWVVRDTANIVISYEPPLVIFRSKLMDVPGKNREAFFRLLLECNASEMIHGAYGIEGDVVALIDTLQSEHLDLNELQATVDALLLAISQEYQKLKSFRD
jgi:hypothetical protein